MYFQGICILSLFLLSLVAGGEPLTECIDFLSKKLCLNLTTTQCFNFGVDLTFDGKSILGQPRNLPLGTFLQTAQFMKRLGKKIESCQKVSDSCQTCEEVTQIEMNSNTGHLHLCFKPKFNCSDLPFQIPIPDSFMQERCLDIDNCQMFGCTNNCSGHGTCGQLGVGCTCDPGYYGPICAISQTDGCILLNPNGTKKICYGVPSAVTNRPCIDEVGITVSSTWTQDNDTALFFLGQPRNAAPILGCHPGGFGDDPLFQNCTFCLDFNHIEFEDGPKELVGTPILRTSCYDQDILATTLQEKTVLGHSANFNKDCDKVPTGSTGSVTPPPDTIAPSPVPEPSTDGPNQLSTNTLYVAVVIVGVFVVVVAAGGYFAWMHYKDRQSASQIGDEKELSVSISSSDGEFERQAASKSLNDTQLDISSDDDD